MKIATTTGDFDYYVKTFEDCVKYVHEAGFKYVDMNLGGKYFTADDWEYQAKALREYADKLGVKFVQAHSPNATVLTSNRWDKELHYGNRSIELCEILGVENLVIHAAYDKSYDKKIWYEENEKFYRALLPMAEKKNVCILTENTTHANFGDGWFYLYTGEDMVEFIEYINHPLLEAVWDTGHGTTEGSQYDNIVALGKHLRGLHVHDNNGKADEHAMPYTGVLNLDQVMNALIDIDYKGYFTFEVINAMRLANRRQAFEKDNRLAQPTLEMRKYMEKLLYHIGEYALSSYGIFEK